VKHLLLSIIEASVSLVFTQYQLVKKRERERERERERDLLIIRNCIRCLFDEYWNHIND